MSGTRPLQRTSVLALIAFLMLGCNLVPGPAATATPYPTYTLPPSQTPYPTYTPVPPTPTPTIAGVGDWVKGHFWSIKVDSTSTETELDGIHPQNGTFILVDVQWKANGLGEMHTMAGIDFELVDMTGEQYRIAGMIYDRTNYKAYGDDAKFYKGKWQITKARGTASKVYRLVFDVPSSATGLRLWFRDLPLIDLGI